MDAGVFEDILMDIYSKGRELNYKTPQAAKRDLAALEGPATPGKK